MQESNPYQTPSPSTPAVTASHQPRSRIRWSLTGLALGAAIPVAFGSYGMYQHQLYLASLGPNEAACGMGALASFMMIFIVGPFCGMIGAGCGWLASSIKW